MILYLKKYIDCVKFDIDWQYLVNIQGNCAVGVTMRHFCIFLLVNISRSLRQFMGLY